MNGNRALGARLRRGQRGVGVFRRHLFGEYERDALIVHIEQFGRAGDAARVPLTLALVDRNPAHVVAHSSNTTGTVFTPQVFPVCHTASLPGATR